MHHEMNLTILSVWMIAMGFPIAAVLGSMTKKDEKPEHGIVTFRRRASIHERRR